MRAMAREEKKNTEIPVKTYQWSMTFGVNEGYPGKVKNDKLSIKEVGKILQSITDFIHQRTDVYLTGVLTESLTIYSTEKGCPLNGEETFTYTISINPHLSENIDLNRIQKAVNDFAQTVKERFNQKTLTVIENKIRHSYFTLDKDIVFKGDM